MVPPGLTVCPHDGSVTTDLSGCQLGHRMQTASVTLNLYTEEGGEECCTYMPSVVTRGGIEEEPIKKKTVMM